MYGSSGKFGRGGGSRGGGGGGGSGGKRNIQAGFHPTTMNRPSSAGGRPSTSGAGAAPRNRTVSASVPSSSAPCNFSAREETYSLVTSNPLNFAMTIRLAPNLVEEIKRVEAQGGVARIKFDGNINNPVGNIISVGGKEFRFTWSPETGDLCDIYEERESGEDGNGLLVESGSAWRKLNVQRVLDESTKNHVKLLSEEADRKHKSRKSIVLDHGNPSTKSQIKALAAAESNPRRNFIAKKEQPPNKKRTIDLMSDGFPSGGPTKSLHKSVTETPPPSKARGLTSSPAFAPEQMDVSASSPFVSGNITKGHSNTENMSTPDMNRAAIDYDEGIIAGRLVNNSVQEKTGIKGSKSNQISDLRTLLISLLMENSLKGMSLKTLEKAAEDAIPNSARRIEQILKKIATLQAPGKYFLKPGVEIESLKKPFSDRQSSPEGSLHHLQENGKKYDPPDASDLTLPKDQNTQLRSESEDAVDIDALHADLFEEKKESDNNESKSDSDTDSDSSDSGSHSKSRSRSVAGSGSGSSSDSESDASTNNSKEVSDVDVDIMTSDDNEEKHRIQVGPDLLIEVAERQDDNSMLEIEKEDLLPPERINEPTSIINSLPEIGIRDHVEEATPVYSCKVDSERDSVYKSGFNHELSETCAKISSKKTKRGLDEKKFDSKSTDNKRVKSGSIGSLQNPSSLMENTMGRDNNAGIGLENELISGKSISNHNVKTKNSATRERSSGKQQSENLSRNVKHSDKSLRTPQSSTSRKVKVSGETKEDMLTSFTGSGKSSKDGFRDKRAPSVDSYQRSVLSSSQTVNHHPLKDDEANKSAGNGRPRVLHRELSDLELGELREPLPEEASGLYKKQIDRKSSSENKSFGLDASNSKPSKLKPPGHINPAPINPVVLSTTPQHHVEDNPRSHQRAIRPHQPRGDQMDIVTPPAPEVNGKSHVKLPANNNNALKEHVIEEVNVPPKKENRKLKPNILPDLNNKQKDASLTESNDSNQRRRESSSDESSCPYSKYEKDEPQLKGSIKDSSEYSEYVKEYQEKYDIYVSLNRVIESSREKFLKYQREISELDIMKDTEKYRKLIRQVKESFDQSVERHKRLKKIFYILHEELTNLKQKIKEFAAPYLTK